MNNKEFQIVSAPFASGVSWLVNILLELNIKMISTAPLYQEDQWIDQGKKSVLSERSLNFFKNYFPILSRNENSFCFDESFEGFWEHRLDFCLHPHRPTILYVRDPRDAIFSLYRRNYSQTLSFEEYLLTPSFWPDHFPYMFGLPPVDTWAYYNLFWYYLRDHFKLKIVSFESMRANPEEEVNGILKFLGIEKKLDQIKMALNNSSLEILKKNSDVQNRKQSLNMKVALKGKVGEWKRHFTPFQKSFFDTDLIRYAMDVFGYETSKPDKIANFSFPSDLRNAAIIDDCISSALRAGDLFQSKIKLNDHLYKFKSDFSKYLQLLAAKIAITWTGLVTSNKVRDPKIIEPIYNSFLSINRYLYIKHIFLSLNNPHTSDPILIQEGYEGYNIVKLGTHYWALLQSLGPLDLSRPDTDRLLEKYKQEGQCFSADSPSELKKFLSSLDSHGAQHCV